MVYWYSLPYALFRDPLSSVIEDRTGELLGARIAEDGQWRFPYSGKIPEKYRKALVLYEDRYFYYHPGVNPASLFRAASLNLSKGRIVSGGSTLSMQVIRLMRRSKPRNLLEKAIEIILATRLEIRYSKKEILALYASNAPFGGNVVGLAAASWRYFGRPPETLSWAETVTLAILPNSPALVHPGKNRDVLLHKRNNLLDRLCRAGAMDGQTCMLARSEPLPDKPYPIPRIAPHLLDRVTGERPGEITRTTLDHLLQKQVVALVESHHKELMFNQVHNAAALVVEVETGNVLAYVGNTSGTPGEDHGNDVDVITAPRSTGSILKPLLYAAMLEDGDILPTMLVPDIPIQVSGYAPQNYTMTYSGAVPAKQALARSLNVPAVRMLQQYGIERFHYLLKRLDLSTITFPPEHYGLSLILGGAEGTLWDLAGTYASFARILNHFQEFDGKYSKSDMHPPVFILEKDGLSPGRNPERKDLVNKPALSAGSLWLTFEALDEVNRPDEEAAWRLYAGSKKVAWKTGTSFGYRDGWAIGTTPGYVVAVWTGNASGEGRPGLTGIAAAAPLMFDIFNLLPPTGWFSIPYDDLIKVAVCRQSGYRAGELCAEVDSVWIPRAGLKTRACPYHRLIHLDKTCKYRVISDCESVNNMVHKKWFVLPPAMEWYYKSYNPDYLPLPPFRKDCLKSLTTTPMEFIYPREAEQVYIPKEIDGAPGKVVFEVAHRDPSVTIYWHLDEQYLGSTRQIHRMGLRTGQGKHRVTVVDENGNTIYKNFEVLGRKIN